MRTFTRPRYGCDHCKKVGGSKRHMAKHEEGCTNNPNRVCRLHEVVTGGEEVPPTVQELMTALEDGGYPLLVEVSHNCPACKLAALRQSWVKPDNDEPWPAEPQDGRQDFNFRKEVDSAWQEHNARAAEENPCYSVGHY
jgi:hypothetical protein